MVKPLIENGVNAEYITKQTSSISDLISRKIIESAIAEIGEPPVRFAFICMGSEGRSEETLLTDQDNAIIYENVSEDREKTVNEYFLKLATQVCTHLNFAGYNFCRGNLMAMNPEWCKPISVWEKYFQKWILNPEPQNVLDVLIFFDFRTVYGDEIFAANLRSYIAPLVAKEPVFFYHLAQKASSFKPSLSFSGNIIVESNKPGEDVLDIKHALIPIIMFARIYSLQNDIRCTNTVERIMKLYEKQIINSDALTEMIFAYNYLMRIRFIHQLLCIQNKNPTTNLVNIKRLTEIELMTMKKIFSQISNYQTRLNFEFKGTI
jgi:CBS domain-containing protein